MTWTQWHERELYHCIIAYFQTSENSQENHGYFPKRLITEKLNEYYIGLAMDSTPLPTVSTVQTDTCTTTCGVPNWIK